MDTINANLKTASTIHRNTRGGACLPRHRDRIVLLLGVLTEMGQRWPVARNALHPLRLVADTIFGTSHAQGAPKPSQALIQDGDAGLKDAQAGVPWFDLFSVDDLMADFLAPDPGRPFSGNDLV